MFRFFKKQIRKWLGVQSTDETVEMLVRLRNDINKQLLLLHDMLSQLFEVVVILARKNDTK